MEGLPMSRVVMRLAGLFLLVVGAALFLSSAANRAFAADITWTNAAGGNWSNPANWNSGAGPVPGSGDNALITTDGTYTVTLDVNATVASLTLGGSTGTQTLGALGRALTLGGPSTIGAQGFLSLATQVDGAGP